MQAQLQRLVQRTFSIGPFAQPALGRAARFSIQFGLFVFTIGAATLVFPEAIGGAIKTQGNAAAQERLARQQSGILLAVIGYFNFIAGRNNADWFFAGGVLERFTAAFIVLALVLSGRATFKEVAAQVVIDLAAAAYTYKLYQQDLADEKVQRRQ